jgi:hypothetical protein
MSNAPDGPLRPAVTVWPSASAPETIVIRLSREQTTDLSLFGALEIDGHGVNNHPNLLIIVQENSSTWTKPRR